VRRRPRTDEPRESREEPARGHRAGFVALVGEPNVGKSTLLNRLLGQKIAIVSPKPQTTRNRILGVVTEPGYQLALLDTPGIHRARAGLNQAMVEAAFTTLREVDLVALVVDAGHRPGLADAEQGIARVISELRQSKRPSALIVNKVDNVKKPALLPFIQRWTEEHPFDLVYPLSALKGDNVEGLPGALAALLPEGPALFPPDMVTDQAERVIAGELVREQLFRQTSQEIPYGVAVEIEEFDESRRGGQRPLVRILATLHVERQSQKGILIGKGGAKLKAIGTSARREIETLLGCQVYLGLNVRVEENWTTSERAVHRFGYGPRE
jgi:GTP-binding protein Era